ncbi:MAG: sulfotransferase [Porticoccaceae bacterium]|nr:MAG: sulfotransferase [Porticoccaceae bacterium]
MGLDAGGRQRAAEVCHWLLTYRLRFFDDHKTHEGIDREPIERPLVVTGEPRSGTTLAHALLAVDPDARPLRFWEVMYPSPPPGLAAPDDRRRVRADADWLDINAMAPEWLKIHPYNDMLGNGLPECERTWAFDFRVMTPTAWWRAPIGMFVGGLPVDEAAMYRIHRMMLQHCQYGRPRKRWALKGFHGPRLATFFATYPDVRILWIHRDPLQVAASRVAMAIALTRAFSGRRPVDEEAIAATHLAATRASIRQTLDNPLVSDPRIHHVRYPDFVADPVGTLADFYAFAGVPFTPAAERAMRHYLEANRGDRYGKFVYSVERLGADLAELEREFEPYRARFGLEPERRGRT